MTNRFSNSLLNFSYNVSKEEEAIPLFVLLCNLREKLKMVKEGWKREKGRNVRRKDGKKEERGQRRGKKEERKCVLMPQHISKILGSPILK